MPELPILEQRPFALEQKEKEKVFLPAMQEAVQWHYSHCPEFKKMCDNRGFEPNQKFELADLPYLPVSLFKDFDLLSAPQQEIIKTLYSSSTSGKPSKIMLDQLTADRQALALRKILLDFLGKERRHFIIFDTEETVQAKQGELSSRGAAIRGMLQIAKKLSFVLDKELNLDMAKLQKAVSAIGLDEKLCFFGFTWLIYNLYLENKDNEESSKIFKKLASSDSLALHIGGWKKLKDLAIDKPDFNQRIGQWLKLEKGSIIDFYGMTEQLGTVYPDCSYGFKHLPLYSEILIRDINTLEPVEIGKPGFIQLLSPLPQSYPGISLLSDDLGKVIGIDDCQCGRKGKYFVFEKRSEQAELKGCGDTLNV